MSAAVFREITDADVEQVVALWRACGLTRPVNDPYLDIADARANPTSTVLVGFVDGEPAASVMAGFDGHRGWVYYLAVAPDHRSGGLGRATMTAAEDWLRAAGVRKLRLMVRAGNQGVLGFYAALGYTEADAGAVLGRDLLPVSADA